MIGYAFHPDAFADLDEIWEYIAQENMEARVVRHRFALQLLQQSAVPFSKPVHRTRDAVRRVAQHGCEEHEGIVA